MERPTGPTVSVSLVSPQAYDTDGVAVDGMAKGVVGKTVTFAGRSQQQADNQ